jgi:hypothetical protein
MKCIQRLCQRTKNLKLSGYCNICDDLIEELKKKHEAVERQRTFSRVEIDFRLLKDTHEKLINGNKVDANIVNILLLGGINNILSQSEVFDDTFERVKALESENVANKMRIESLETWILKLNDKTEEVQGKITNVDPDKETEHLEQRIDALGRELNTIKEAFENPSTSASPTYKISCRECGENFERNCDYESHMVDFHDCEQMFSCEECGKKFYLEWRFKKNASVHKENIKTCKYFHEGKVCPFEKVGCKFLHGQG